ncbi:hypothetical protein [Methanimicrococcus blatticola]|nr:hypothetical protein [Methanimicrococcus blatticola]
MHLLLLITPVRLRERTRRHRTDSHRSQPTSFAARELLRFLK